jgi:NAD(P)H-hydrate epimerase
MKILHQSQIQEADRQTIAQEPITSIDLMDRAAMACREWIVERYDNSQSFCLLCGTGNNGGDGLALYRLLTDKQYPCTLFEFPLGQNPTKDYAQNRKRVNIAKIQKLSPEGLSSLPKDVIIIDGLLGTGLNRPVSGALKKIIQTLNTLPNLVFSIDIPSGLFSEFNGDNPSQGIVQAHHTLSFQMPKLAFLLPEMGAKAGQFHLLDIRLLPSYLKEVKTNHYYLTSQIANSCFRPPNKFDHKGINGHHLLMAGSKGKMGAAVLAAQAALRTGLGKLSILTPQCGVEILQNTIPEAMVETNTGKYCLSGYYGLKYDTVSLGPGLGTDSETKDFLETFFTKTIPKWSLMPMPSTSLLPIPNGLTNSQKTPYSPPIPKSLKDWLGLGKKTKRNWNA